MRTTKITIANKRFIKSTDRALVFSVSGYGKDIFTIPKVAIVSSKSVLIPINEVTDEPATEYTIHKWLFDKIESELKKMSQYHLTMPNGDN